MKEKEQIIKEIIEDLRKKRQQHWAFYHECQDWKLQKETTLPYDEVLCLMMKALDNQLPPTTTKEGGLNQKVVKRIK